MFGYKPAKHKRLHEASAAGDISRVRELLMAGADPDKYENEGHNTALHRAAAEGHRYVVITLLESGADHHIQDNDGKKAIDLAHNNEVASLIGRKYLEEEYNDNIHYNSPVSKLLSQGQHDLVWNFLEKMPSVERRGNEDYNVHSLSLTHLYSS